MTELYDKICPLLTREKEQDNKCRGSRCAFAAPKIKTWVNEKGEICSKKEGWYCIVRDFLISMSALSARGE